MIFVWNYQLSSFVENKDLRSFVAKWWKLQFAHFWGKLSQEIPAARKVIAFPCTVFQWWSIPHKYIQKYIPHFSSDEVCHTNISNKYIQHFLSYEVKRPNISDKYIQQMYPTNISNKYTQKKYAANLIYPTFFQWWSLPQKYIQDFSSDEVYRPNIS